MNKFGYFTHWSIGSNWSCWWLKGSTNFLESSSLRWLIMNHASDDHLICRDVVQSCKYFLNIQMAQSIEIFKKWKVT